MELLISACCPNQVQLRTKSIKNCLFSFWTVVVPQKTCFTENDLQTKLLLAWRRNSERNRAAEPQGSINVSITKNHSATKTFFEFCAEKLFQPKWCFYIDINNNDLDLFEGAILSACLLAQELAPVMATGERCRLNRWHQQNLNVAQT